MWVLTTKNGDNEVQRPARVYTITDGDLAVNDKTGTPTQIGQLIAEQCAAGKFNTWVLRQLYRQNFPLQVLGQTVLRELVQYKDPEACWDMIRFLLRVGVPVPDDIWPMVKDVRVAGALIKHGALVPEDVSTVTLDETVRQLLLRIASRQSHEAPA